MPLEQPQEHQTAPDSPRRRLIQFDSTPGAASRALPRFWTAIAAAAVSLSGMEAAAHPIAPSQVQVRVQEDGAFQIRLRVDLHDTTGAPSVPGVPMGPLPQDAMARSRTGLFFQESAILKFDGAPASAAVAALDWIPATGAGFNALSAVEVHMTGSVPSGAKSASWWSAVELGSSILRWELPGGRSPDAVLLKPGEESPAVQLAPPVPGAQPEPPPSRSAVFWRYLALGFEHILPKGLDHILFVLGLFLLAAAWRPLLWQVSAFTLAHTLTLALSIYGVVELSPSLVEPLIALSIAFVAIENLFTSRLSRWRPLVVFGFGLLHGLGFAGVLTELGLPRERFLSALIAFNLGVEGGQLAVLAAAFLTVGWFRKAAWYRKAVTMPLSVAIALTGLYWTWERIAGG